MSDTPNESLVIDIDGEVVEPELEQIEVEDLTKGLSNKGRLVKRWRLTGKINVIRSYRNHYDQDESVRVVTHVYLDPDSGSFYSRVPEVEDGALYVADDLKSVRKKLYGAVRALSQQLEDARAHVVDDRVWTRIIRISYPRIKQMVPHWRTGSPNNYSYYHRYDRPGFIDWDEHFERAKRSVPESDVVGPLYITRLETALRPDGRLDVREWQEDHQSRIALWDKRSEPSKDPTRPTRLVAIESVPSGSRFQAGRSDNTRQFPWSEDLWRAFNRFQDRIREMDGLVRAFLTSTETEALMQGLLNDTGVPLLGADSSDEER